MRSLGTFRPDRIKSIADRFGVDGDMALENILYGTVVSNFVSNQSFHILHSSCP